MKKVKTLYDLVLDLTDKNAGRYFTEDEFNRALRMSELELFDECIGATNKKLDNRNNVAYGKSQDTDAGSPVPVSKFAICPSVSTIRSVGTMYLKFFKCPKFLSK